MRNAVLLVAFAIVGCHHNASKSSADAGMDAGADTEQVIRTRLGVPADAKSVMVVSQSSHLDIDWQRTFDDYYSTWVEDVFLSARQLLDQQPRAVYSVAEMAYLKYHLQQHPEELAPLKKYIASGALRMVGGGMTSPDTVLPETELLMRDYLYGARFIEDTLGGHATTAWLPDSFGHAETAPDILAAAGFTAVGFSRIDGAVTLTQWLSDPSTPPMPDSTASQLLKLGSADFLWQGPAGGVVLGHLLTDGLYCMGDNIDLEVEIEMPGQITGTSNTTPAYTDGKITSYIRALKPYTKTPYMFVPVGCDFQSPKTGLISYLDGWNQRQYPTTGVWAVAASFEDYSQLVLAHKDELPTLQTDLTPYFMGFYGTRADVKELTREAARPYFAAETFASVLGADAKAAVAAAQPSFELLTRSDHHDFVTGTSNDLVASTEQLPLLASLETAGETELTAVATSLAQRIPPVHGSVARIIALNPAAETRSDVVTVTVPFSPPVSSLALQAQSGSTAIPLVVSESTPATPTGYSSVTFELLLENMAPYSWEAIDVNLGAAAPATDTPTAQLLDASGNPTTSPDAQTIILTNQHVRAEFTRMPGFELTSLQIDGVEAIAAPSFTVNAYNDMGGLWRLGNEMTGCSLTELAPSTADEMAETYEVIQDPLSVHVTFTAADGVREAWLDADSTGLAIALTTSAPTKTMITAQFTFTGTTAATLATSLAAGYAVRPVEHVYTPTYWPAVNWVSAGNWGVMLRQSTGVRFDATGDVELMAVRNAPVEQCDYEGGFGSDDVSHRLEWRIEAVSSPAVAEQTAQLFNRPVSMVPTDVAPATTTDLSARDSILQLTGPGVVSALKPADRGEGVILRVQLMPGPVTVQLGSMLAGSTATRDDIAERDIASLGTVGSTLTLDQATYGALATIRLVPQ